MCSAAHHHNDHLPEPTGLARTGKEEDVGEVARTG